MANIRKVLGNIKNQDKTEKDDYERSIILHKRRKRITIGLVIATLIIAFIVYKIYENTVKYEEYSVGNELNIDDGAGNQYVAYGDFFVKYGTDGISYQRGNEVVWSQAYEMTHPVVDVCGEYVAVGDKQTNTIYVFNEEGNCGKITTSYPIINIEVADQGVTAALLEEDTANYIEVYDKNGEPLISHKTLLNGNGYPLSFSLSDDGKKMIVSYVCVNSGTMESKVLFYNFSDVGQNEVDRMVGGFNHYDSTVIPVVKFLQNNKAIAVGDNVLSIYTMKEKPSLDIDIPIEDEIEKLFYNEDYIGMAFKEDNGSSMYRVKVYDLKGNVKMDQPIDMYFESIKFSGNNILINDDMNCKIISFGGRVRFEYSFEEAIVEIIPTDDFREYLLVSNNYVRRIRIK